MTKTDAPTAHSPLPWRLVDELANLGLGRVCTANDVMFAVDDGSEPAYMRLSDAEFIVRACNSHYDLLAALKAIESEVESSRAACSPAIYVQVKDAIAKAEGR